MQVDSGIETENLDTAQDAIAAQLDAICKGDITDAEMDSTMMTIHNTLCGIGDTATSYISWYFGQFCRGTKLTPAEEEENYRKVTKGRSDGGGKVHAAGYHLYYGMQRTGGGVTWQRPQ